jgi:hypothetical protein
MTHKCITETFAMVMLLRGFGLDGTIFMTVFATSDFPVILNRQFTSEIVMNALSERPEVSGTLLRSPESNYSGVTDTEQKEKERGERRKEERKAIIREGRWREE